MSNNKINLNYHLLVTGGVFGLFFALLVKLGNPANMGVCVVCFIRDIAGAIGLHSVVPLSYIRPEIIGFVLGATIIALIAREFKATGGSSPLIRFVIGIFIGVGALVFLGCPVRMFGRIAGGDWTALLGLLGVIVGVYVGTLLLKKGFTLGRAQPSKLINAWIMPVIMVALLVALLINPTNITLSVKGHAPIFISLVFGIILGLLGQLSRYCTIGGIRDIILMKNFDLIQGTVTFLVVGFVVNLILNQFHSGAHPIAHTDLPWNFLSMFLVGLGSVMIGGCPFRQTVMAGQGNTDASFSILGILIGVGLGHNFGLLASPSGVPVAGKISIVIGIVVLLVTGLLSVTKQE